MVIADENSPYSVITGIAISSLDDTSSLDEISSLEDELLGASSLDDDSLLDEDSSLDEPCSLELSALEDEGLSLDDEALSSSLLSSKKAHEKHENIIHKTIAKAIIFFIINLLVLKYIVIIPRNG